MIKHNYPSGFVHQQLSSIKVVLVNTSHLQASVQLCGSSFVKGGGLRPSTQHGNTSPLKMGEVNPKGTEETIILKNIHFFQGMCIKLRGS